MRALLLITTVCLMSGAASAAELSVTSNTTDMVPASTTTIDGELPAGQYPVLRLTPDKIEVVRLDRDAVSVVVGNSAHLLAITETPRQVLLVPRQPGATHFQVLDAKGGTIMERSVIVAAPTQDYVRVRRACANSTSGDCHEFSVFYCPEKDMCHDVVVTQEAKGAAGGGSVPAEAASAPLPEMINDQPVPASSVQVNGVDNSFPVQ